MAWYNVCTVDPEKRTAVYNLGRVTRWAVEADSKEEARSRLQELFDEGFGNQVPHANMSIYKLDSKDFVIPGRPKNPHIDLTLSK